MALVRKKATEVVKGSSDRADIDWGNLKPGDYEGRLVYVADLGLQAKTYNNEFQGNFQQIALGIELVGQTVTVEKEGEEDVILPRILWAKPFNIFSDMDEKSNEFKYYSMFDSNAEGGVEPDWEAQLNKPIMVTVENNPGKGANKDKLFDNIKSLAKIPEKYQADVGEALTTPGVGDSDDPKNAVTKALFGLAKYVFDKRIKDEAPEEAPQEEAKGAPMPETEEAEGNPF